MVRNKHMILFILAVAVLASLVLCGAAWADRLNQALEQAKHLAPETIQGEPGYLGIPGAPTPIWWVGLLWAFWVGWIFSTVGAFGGIMAGVGHITIFGLGDYAKTFAIGEKGEAGHKSLMLNKVITDSIRVSNQWLGGSSAAISSFNYYRMGRLVAPIGFSLAIGSIAGSWLIPILSAGKIDLSSYIGYFGLFVLFLGCYLFWETTPAGQARKKNAREAAKAFQESVKQQRDGGAIDTSELGVKMRSFSPTQCVFTFYGVEFSFNPFLPLIGGFFIAGLASFLGVGGGFLLVPFLTSVTGLPMYLVAGTSALAVFIGMVNSLASYMLAKGTPVHWSLIGIEIIGVVLGSLVGPRTSKYIPDVWLKRLFVVLALYVGIRYATKGFFGTSWLPPS